MSISIYQLNQLLLKELHMSYFNQAITPDAHGEPYTIVRDPVSAKRIVKSGAYLVTISSILVKKSLNPNSQAKKVSIKYTTDKGFTGMTDIPVRVANGSPNNLGIATLEQLAYCCLLRHTTLHRLQAPSAIDNEQHWDDLLEGELSSIINKRCVLDIRVEEVSIPNHTNRTITKRTKQFIDYILTKDWWDTPLNARSYLNTTSIVGDIHAESNI
jgi:hypothetical protein